ncbi:MAG: nuclear transport factor 2 family protein [Hyphomicrobiales bacterium]
MALSVEDQLEIQQLYARYNHYIDSGRAEEWADCFTADGRFSSASGDFTGREALAGFAKGYAERLKGRHWTNNLVLEATEKGARGSCYLILFALTGQQPPAAPLVTGIYEDELVRDGGSWKFTRRTVHGDA